MMNNDIFVHVGLPKTGTTWLQKEVFGKMNDIQYIDYLYLYSFIKSDKKTVISMESLSGVPDLHVYNTREQVAYRLCSMFPSAKIIVGFRDTEKWVRSLYNQSVKGGEFHSFRYWKKYCFDDRFCDYDEYLFLLNSLFDDVFVYSFEQDIVGDKNGFVCRLCDFMNVEIPDFCVDPVNVSLSESKLNVIRWSNQYLQSVMNPDGVVPVTVGKLFRSVIRRIQ